MSTIMLVITVTMFYSMDCLNKANFFKIQEKPWFTFVDQDTAKTHAKQSPYKSVVMFVTQPWSTRVPICGGNIIYHDEANHLSVMLTAGHCCHATSMDEDHIHKISIMSGTNFETPYYALRRQHVRYTESTPKKFFMDDVWDALPIPYARGINFRAWERSTQEPDRTNDYCVIAFATLPATPSTAKFWDELVTPAAQVLDPWIGHTTDGNSYIDELKLVSFWPTVDEAFGEEVQLQSVCGRMKPGKPLITYYKDERAEGRGNPPADGTACAKNTGLLRECTTTSGFCGGPIFKQVGGVWYQIGVHVAQGVAVYFDENEFETIAQLVGKISDKVRIERPGSTETMGRGKIKTVKEISHKLISPPLGVISAGGLRIIGQVERVAHSENNEYGDNYYYAGNVDKPYPSRGWRLFYDYYFAWVLLLDIVLAFILICMVCLVCFAGGYLSANLIVPTQQKSNIT